MPTAASPSPRLRSDLYEQAKALYSVDAPNSQKILECVSLASQQRLRNLTWSMLAYLAERMIEMNKEKNATLSDIRMENEGCN